MGNLYIEGLPGSLRTANYLCPRLARDREAFKGNGGPNSHVNILHCDTKYYQMDHMRGLSYFRTTALFQSTFIGWQQASLGSKYML